MQRAFKRTHLYLKTHNITGLKYFGKTIKDPYKYSGSGTYWKKHLAMYGYDCSTEIIGIYDDKEECMKSALNYSLRFDVAKSSDYANLKIENGDDGGSEPGAKRSEETKRRISERMMGNNHNPMIGTLKGIDHPMFGKKHSEEAKRRISEKNKGFKNKIGKCIHCEIECTINNIMRWHNNKCKNVL